MRYWVGFDVGKAFHWVCVLDEEGEEAISRRVDATEEDLEASCEEIAALGGDRAVGIDLTGEPADLGFVGAREDRTGHRYETHALDRGYKTCVVGCARRGCVTSRRWSRRAVSQADQLTRRLATRGHRHGPGTGAVRWFARGTWDIRS